ncbi:polyprenyl synthetase family protein [Haloglycomyces albus]|uniref:polyprenyl synthetase family protein n=1 Tax=Haloglycomyces albus TaxID=526067 RepID=UPI00046C9430|nr:polyprenyl synthetase family protein [Haloglycomyces albus]
MATTEQAQNTPMFTDPEFAQSVSAALSDIEDGLLRAVDTEHPLLRETGAHLINAGGKRFRPLLTLTAAQLGDPEAPGVHDAAVALELTHLATLYHDDVMDEASKRRGGPSANQRWTNSVAILTGDHLFSLAAQIMATLGPRAVRYQAETFARLVRGQINETIPQPDATNPIDWHLDILAEKTGSLIACCAHFGAWLSGAPESQVKTVGSFGETVGVAFQIADDIIDVSSDNSGKTPGTDLMEGIPTLPVLYALQGTDPHEARLRELVSKPVAAQDLDEALSLLRRSEGLRQARKTLDGYLNRARELADSLPKGHTQRAFWDICDYMADRQT